MKFIFLIFLVTSFTSCDRPKNPAVNVACSDADEKAGKCTKQKGLPDPAGTRQPADPEATRREAEATRKEAEAARQQEAERIRRCQVSPSSAECQGESSGTSEACRLNPSSTECLGTSGITDRAGFERCVADGTSTREDCLRQYGGDTSLQYSGSYQYQQCLQTYDESTCRSRYGNSGLSGSSAELSDCLTRAYSESSRQECYTTYGSGSGLGGDSYQYRQCIASDDSYSNRERCQRLYGNGSGLGTSELERRCSRSDYQDTSECIDYLRRKRIECERQEARGYSSVEFDCSDFISSGDPTTRDSLSSDHGSRYLLVHVEKDEHGHYALFIDSIDQNVRNIRIAYVAGSAFAGKKGPVIRAKVQWEYNSRTCVGKTTIFSLKDYSNTKKLLTDCGV
jgi:hypothetical protein